MSGCYSIRIINRKYRKKRKNARKSTVFQRLKKMEKAGILITSALKERHLFFIQVTDFPRPGFYKYLSKGRNKNLFPRKKIFDDKKFVFFEKICLLQSNCKIHYPGAFFPLFLCWIPREQSNYKRNLIDLCFCSEVLALSVRFVFPSSPCNPTGVLSLCIPKISY